MRKLLVAALLVFIISASAHAEARDWRDWYRKALSAAQSLVQPRRPDREVIAAPSDLDRKMALIPPASGPRMPIIRPDPAPKTSKPSKRFVGACYTPMSGCE